MQRPPSLLGAWGPAGVGALSLLTLVSLPAELAIGLVDQPVVAPMPVVTLLQVGSCSLLIWSGLGLRRLEAARALAERPAPGA